MPVRETSGGKLIIRIADADLMSDQAKRFMNKRLMPHNNDGNLWVLPSPTPVEIAALKSLGFEYFARIDPPYVENWSCTFSDESATFGAVEGVYFTRSNTTKFPHLSGFADSTTVSRWKWIRVQCEWYLGDGPIGGILGCALVPFFE